MKKYSAFTAMSFLTLIASISIALMATFAVSKARATKPVPSATPAASPVAATPVPKGPVDELTRSSVEQLAKDFMIACEMSKLSINLGKTSAFKNDPADLAYRVAELMSGAFKTTEVKDTYRAITAANPNSRVALWHASAKELGVKDFKCKTIGFK